MDENLEMIHKIKQGDEEAFSELLKAHHKMIYKIINSFYLENGDYAVDKNDLYQEASLALYSAVFSFEENKDTKFSTYAYMLIRSKLLNILRSYFRTYEEEKYSIDNTEAVQITAVNDNPIDYHKEREFEKYLGTFIQGLSPEDRQILKLRYEDMTYKEIAQLLQINTKRIDNRLRSLRKRLKAYLEEGEKTDG